MTLQADERKSLVEYRKERALSALNEAKDVATFGHWNLAVQRLYYATYYAQCALLINNGNQAASHVGVKSLISLNFVKTGKLTKDDGNLLGKLFSMRQTGDYSDYFEWTQEDVEPLMDKTVNLVNKIFGLIEK